MTEVETEAQTFPCGAVAAAAAAAAATAAEELPAEEKEQEQEPERTSSPPQVPAASTRAPSRAACRPGKHAYRAPTTSDELSC